jgi:hypothetical protein
MAKKKKELSSEKKEVWMRIPIFIVSGIILHVWGFFIFCFALAQFVLILAKDKKEEELSRMCNIYLIQLYIFVKYVTFLSDKRPFPFGELEKEIKEKK